jgi:hypothetical protein
MATKNTKDTYVVRVGRDSRDGQFITVKEANQRPSTTQVEHIKVPRDKS